MTAAVVTSMAGAGHAAAVDLSTWSAEGPENWNVSGSKDSLLQTQNGQPTVFHNNQMASQGNDLRGTIEVQTSSVDDFIGFVLGYNAGDPGNTNAGYLLVDWKQGNQNNFGCADDAGLSISRVQGTLGNNSDAWCHDPANNVTELDRATTLGNNGWADNTEYKFKINFTSNLVEVFVNDVLEISVAGSFFDGGFGFYNYSQQSVRYAGVEFDVLPPIPVPASLPLLLAGFAGLTTLRSRKG
jgi:hypothetical protein